MIAGIIIAAVEATLLTFQGLGNALNDMRMKKSQEKLIAIKQELSNARNITNARLNQIMDQINVLVPTIEQIDGRAADRLKQGLTNAQLRRDQLSEKVSQIDSKIETATDKASVTPADALISTFTKGKRYKEASQWLDNAKEEATKLNQDLKAGKFETEV